MSRRVSSHLTKDVHCAFCDDDSEQDSNVVGSTYAEVATAEILILEVQNLL